MPEGDTVHRLADRLSAAQKGQRVLSADLRVPGAATVDLGNAVIDEVYAYGKHLIHRIGDYSLHTHLRMDGRWQVIAAGSSQRWQRPGWAARVVLTTARNTAVGFDLGVVEVLRRERETEAIGFLGPDPLRSDWDADRAIVALERAGAQGTPAAVALGDQRLIAGLGQVYLTEICFLAGIDPNRPMTPEDVGRVVSLAVRTMTANRHRTRRVFTGRDRQGERTWVYGRTGEPCRRCGTPLRVSQLGPRADMERAVTWCPHCQK
ncbi:MAG: DNA-formamidopyrimidine glycosylase family protein [Mycetocola sp.]